MSINELPGLRAIGIGKNELPIHPLTGLRAIGIGKRGPIWPVAGGAPEEGERKAPVLTHSQSINRLKEINSELERLAELNELSPEDEMYFSELTREFDETDAHRKRLERAAEIARVRAASTGLTATSLRVERGGLAPGASASSRDDYDRDPILNPDSIEDCRFRNPWDVSEVRTMGRPHEEVRAELRARALSAISKMSGATDNIREAATRILETSDDKQSSLARQILSTSSPTYLRAWSKMACNNKEALTPEEARAISEVRAMSLTDTAGGFLVPFQLDPTVIITSDGSRNDIRKIARQVVATGDKWRGVSAGEVQWGWSAEGAEATDDSPTFAGPVIDVHKADGFVPISVEALQDEANVTSEVAKLLAEGKDSLEAVAFITGNGTTQPKGLVTALDGTIAEISPTTAETFALADVYALQGALPARYRSEASWLANNLIYNRIRQFDTQGGAGLWSYLGEERGERLLGRFVAEAEAMDSSINPAIAADNFVLTLGDFRNYVIADRVGMVIDFIPHLFGANRRPTGQRGWWAYYRVGADVVNPGAFRILNVATTV